MRHPPPPTRYGPPATTAVQRAMVMPLPLARLVPGDLRELKDLHDRIERRVPATWGARLPILQATLALANDAREWQQCHTQANQIWAAWQGHFNSLAAGAMAVPRPYRKLSVDLAVMGTLLTRFDRVHGQLIDHGLAAVKRALADQWYVTGPVPGLNDEFYWHDHDETLASFQHRMRTHLTNYVTPGQAGWLTLAGYTSPIEPHIEQLAQIGGRDAHWTVYKGGLQGLAALRADAPIATILAALIPTQFGGGVHVTLEVFGANNQNNPRKFVNGGGVNGVNLPGGVTFNDLDTALTNHNQAVTNRITQRVTARLAPLRAGWATH